MNRFLVYLCFLIWCFLMGCSIEDENYSGKYEFVVEGFKNTRSAEMEITGTGNTYFGYIKFLSDNPRTFEIGIKKQTADSLVFRLPGDNGYLSFNLTDSLWSGEFKYFRLQAQLRGFKTAEVSEAMNALRDPVPFEIVKVSTEAEESFPSVDPQTGDLYFTRDSKIFIAKNTGDQFEPAVPFSLHGEFSTSASRFSTEKEQLIFSSNKPLPGSEKKKKNLWVSQRNSEGWNEPEPFPNPVNIDSIGDYHPSISGNGNIYFVSYNRPGGFGRSDIYKASLQPDGSYQVENLGPTINTEASEADVYVDPDERFIIYCATNYEDSYGADDLYLSYNNDGKWSEPENLGPAVNSYAYEYGPWIDWKNEWFYFNSYRRGSSDIYRIELSKLNLKLD